jgi:hypothetical protein
MRDNGPVHHNPHEIGGVNGGGSLPDRRGSARMPA